MPRHRPSFVRTSNGADVDLLMTRGSEINAFEFKLSKSPKPSRGFHELISAIAPQHAWLMAPVDESYDFNKKVTVVEPTSFCQKVLEKYST